MKSVRSHIRFLGLFAAVSLLWSLGLRADQAQGNYIETHASGFIDWTTGVVQARGSWKSASRKDPRPAYEQMLKFARLQARINLMQLVGKIRIYGDDTIEHLMERSEEVKQALLPLVRSARVMEPSTSAAGDARVVVRMSLDLYGGLAQIVLPPDIQQIKPVTTVPRAGENIPDAEENPPAPYTGLIVDARGLAIVPALVVRIVDEDQRNVYGPVFVSREFAVQHGMVGYADTLEQAAASERLGEKPMKIKALRWEGGREPAIIVSNTDATIIRKSSSHLKFLKQCRVWLVIDRKTAQE